MAAQSGEDLRKPMEKGEKEGERSEAQDATTCTTNLPSKPRDLEKPPFFDYYLCLLGMLR
jgi:hypothetical protein